MKNSKQNNKKAFSIAEALITLAIVGIAMGSAAPLISKTMKNSQVSNFQLQYLQRQIDELRNELSDSQSVPDGTVSFFYRTSCPPGWAAITGLDGHYLRIKASAETLGEVKEQMVHKHKHVSPFMQSISDGDNANTFRYGPLRSYHSLGSSIKGDKSTAYDLGSFLQNGAAYTPYNGSTVLLTGIGTSSDNNNWYAYTSDGMNSWETMKTANSNVANILVCPNKDDGNKICNPSNNSFSYVGDGYNMTVKNTPFLAEMPLVGNENRPNSISLIACVSGYSRCTLNSGSLSCSN